MAEGWRMDGGKVRYPIMLTAYSRKAWNPGLDLV